MRKVKNSLRFMIILLCMVLGLTSCSGSNRYKTLYTEPENDSEHKVTLRFISPWAGINIKAEILKRLLNAFMEKNPDVEIINESMTDADFLLKLKTDFVSGNDPDVLAMWPGANMMSFIRAGKIADLTPLLEKEPEWKKSFDKSAWYYITANQRTYGLPMEIIYECLFVNKDMFTAYHVKIPENFEELKQAATDFKRQGVIPIAYNAQSEGSSLYQNIVASLGGRTEVEQLLQDGKVSECYVKAADYMKELYKLGAFPADAVNLSNKERDDLFLQKKAAMIVQASEFIGEVNKQLTTVEQGSARARNSENYRDQLTVDMIPFPAIEGGRADPTALIYGLGSGTFFMSQAAWNDPQKRSAGTRLLRFLTSEESAVLFAEQTRMLVSVKIPTPNVYYSGLMRRGRELIDSTKEPITPPDSLMDKSTWENVVIKQLPYVLDGKKDMAEIWKEVLEWYKATQ